MTKEEFFDLYDKTFGHTNEFYYYNCLRLSGFNKDTAYDLIPVLTDLYLKDESGTSIGTLADALYEHRKLLKENLSTRQLLCRILD